MPSDPTWFVATGQQKKRRVTIVDVARRVGVNKGTVSRALRGMEGVGEDTRKRILAAADELDYSASDLGTALATGTTRTVGIILPTLRSWYFSEVAAGASEVLSAAGFRIELIILDVDSDVLRAGSDSFDQLFRHLGAGQYRDALLFAGTAGIPDAGSGPGMVSAAGQDGPPVTVPGVVIDHQQGGRLAARHLLELGHTSFAVVEGRMTGTPDTRGWELRSAGFLAEVDAAGVDSGQVRVVRPGDCHTAQGESAGSELLAGASLPSALFCHTDELAFGVIAALRRNGVRCPDDVSVVGFDDHPMARLWDLTTVTQHTHEQGVHAALALLGALGVPEAAVGSSGSAVAGESRELQVELIVRDSTARFARSR